MTPEWPGLPGALILVVWNPVSVLIGRRCRAVLARVWIPVVDVRIGCRATVELHMLRLASRDLLVMEVGGPAAASADLADLGPARNGLTCCKPCRDRSFLEMGVERAPAVGVVDHDVVAPAVDRAPVDNRERSICTGEDDAVIALPRVPVVVVQVDRAVSVRVAAVARMTRLGRVARWAICRQVPSLAARKRHLKDRLGRRDRSAGRRENGCRSSEEQQGSACHQSGAARHRPLLRAGTSGSADQRARFCAPRCHRSNRPDGLFRALSRLTSPEAAGRCSEAMSPQMSSSYVISATGLSPGGWLYSSRGSP